MSAPAALYQDCCEYCDKENPADRECDECNTARWVGYMRDWLTRAKTKLPGLTNSEVALVERLIDDLETS